MQFTDIFSVSGDRWGSFVSWGGRWRGGWQRGAIMETL